MKKSWILILTAAVLLGLLWANISPADTPAPAPPVSSETAITDDNAPESGSGLRRMVDDGVFKLLLIGNSFSQDAANCGQGMKDSQLCDILHAMLGEDVDIIVGLLYSGGKGLNWHATQAALDKRSYTFSMIKSKVGTWDDWGTSTTSYALSLTDWDVVTLQPYNIDPATGIEKLYYPDETAEQFYPLKAAGEYMLDYVSQYAPSAEVYFYMHWATTKDTVFDSGMAKYLPMAEYVPTVLDFTGPDSGKQFRDIIPVGLAVQNARTTYLSRLSYNPTAYDDGKLNLKTDAQIGLQRDNAHVSFNIGRYIAALTFAETIIPSDLRTAGYILPDIRTTESIGSLPQEYTEIARRSVLAAVNSWQNGNLSVTPIRDFSHNPAETAAETIKSLSLSVKDGSAKDVAAQIRKAVSAVLPEDCTVVTVIPGADSLSADVTIRFGYTSVTVPLPYAIASHS